MSAGDDIAAEVAAGIAEAGLSTGTGAAAVIVRGGGRSGGAYGTTFAPDGIFPVTAIMSKFSAKEIDGTLIRRDDVKILMAATGEAPLTGDDVVIDGFAHRVHHVMPLRPGSVDLMHTVQCRGGSPYDGPLS